MTDRTRVPPHDFLLRFPEEGRAKLKEAFDYFIDGYPYADAWDIAQQMCGLMYGWSGWPDTDATAKEFVRILNEEPAQVIAYTQTLIGDARRAKETP